VTRAPGPDFTDIRYEKRGAVGIATFDRPDRLNAARAATRRELIALLDLVEHDEAIRVLVITGQGRAFCVGEDLKELNAVLESTPSAEDARRLAELFQEVTRRVVRLAKPIIAAVNGLAVGFGAELAVACDVRVAAEGASFMFPEAKRGLFVTNGLLSLLPRLIGHGRAMELVLTGRAMNAREAYEAGMVTHVAPNERVLDVALEVATTIAANAPISIRLLKRDMEHAQELNLEGAMQLEVEAMAACLGSEDLREGTRAFVEKRPPRYTGR
jgi:enoyl-CoA hydratase/carnithine racemase